MAIVWETRRSDGQETTRAMSSEIAASGKYVTTFTSPESGTHIFSGGDLVFLRDVIAEAVDRLEFELSEADLYKRVRSFEEDRPARAGKRWSQEDHERLVQLLENGIAVAEIATALERSPMSIVTRMLLHGIAEVVPVDPDCAKVRD